MRRAVPIALGAVFLLLPLAATAQVPAMPSDLSGPWSLEASGLLPEENVPCMWKGSGNLTEQGGLLSGNATLMLVSGPAGCPMEMSAILDGSLDGFDFVGTLDGGQVFGLLGFTGVVDPDSRSISGDFTVRQGSFAGIAGTWIAARQSVVEVPTLGSAGLALLVLLLASTSVWIFLSRRRAVP